MFTVLDKELKSAVSANEISVSVGITEICTEKDKVMVLYEHASKALYVAKQTNGHSCYSYHNEYNERTRNYNVIEDIDNLVNLIKNKNTNGGGTRLETDYIKDIITTVVMLNEDSSNVDKIVMLTLKAVPGAKSTAEKLTTVMDILQKAIIDNIRETDKIARYSNSQYIAIFSKIEQNELNAIMSRIMTEFLRTYTEYEYEVHYKISSIG